MERQEAIEIIQERIDFAKNEYADQVPEYIQALEKAVDALRKIDELEELRTPEAVVRIIPALYQSEHWECPNCGDLLTQEDVIAGNCKWCGKSIEFPEEE